MLDRPTADSRAIQIKTRFDYPRGPLPTLLVWIGFRCVTLVLLLLAFFALWNTLHLWHVVVYARGYGP
ncbi:MAG: hypothetical protein L3K18_06120 [Thermoplasmata archaeon]|nr:hypothetical protein [Thermoplasmata archaeon]